MNGKCPKCEQYVSSVNIEDVSVNYQGTPKWKGISYTCPFCNAILSVQIDPIAIRSDLLNGISNVLREKKP